MKKYLLAGSLIAVIFSFQNCGEMSSIEQGAFDSASLANLASIKEVYIKGQNRSYWKCAFTMTGEKGYVWRSERLNTLDDNCATAISNVKANNPKATITGPEKIFVGYHDAGAEVASRVKCQFTLKGSAGAQWKTERVLESDDDCATAKEFVAKSNPNAQIISQRKVDMKFDSTGGDPSYYWRCDYQLTDGSGKIRYLERHSKTEDEGCANTTRSVTSAEKSSSVKWTGSVFMRFDGDLAPGTVPNCGSGKINEVTSSGGGAVLIQCNLKLPRAYNLTKSLIIEGSEASGITIDLAGSTIGGPGQTSQIQVRSKEISANGATSWSVPTNVTIKNGTVYGYAGVTYRSNFWQESNMREQHALSRRPDYIQILKDRSPSDITFRGMKFYGIQGVALYVYPGATGVKVYDSQFLGAASLAIYLDAETEGHVIKNNTFNMETTRELIAIDGSARNLISGNKFFPKKSAIKIYRNCGENGVVRQMKPTHNNILNNLFGDGTSADVVLASRLGKSSFCHEDKDSKLGSGGNDLDFAQYNIVSQNKFLNHNPNITDNDKYNVVTDNVKVTGQTLPKSPCGAIGVKKQIYNHGESIDFSSLMSSSCKSAKFTCNDGEITSNSAKCGVPPLL